MVVEQYCKTSAGKVIPRSNTKLATVLSIVLDPSLDGGSVGAVALKGAVDGSYRGSEPLAYHWLDTVHPIP